MAKLNLPPVITIDGPTASGKGTIARRLAAHLAFHYLDSGALYRMVAWTARQQSVPWDQAQAIAVVAQTLQYRFEGDHIWCHDQTQWVNVTDLIREEAIGLGASAVARHPSVRSALLALQQRCAQAPGLVADGRDMGTVVFPHAPLKIFLTASAEIRAQRRAKQLGWRVGTDSDRIASLLRDLQQRDAQDTQRALSPLVAASDSQLLVNEGISVDQAVAIALHWWQQIV